MLVADLSSKVLGLLTGSPNDCEHHTQVCRVLIFM